MCLVPGNYVQSWLYVDSIGQYQPAKRMRGWISWNVQDLRSIPFRRPDVVRSAYCGNGFPSTHCVCSGRMQPLLRRHRKKVLALLDRGRSFGLAGIHDAFFPTCPFRPLCFSSHASCSSKGRPGAICNRKNAGKTSRPDSPWASSHLRVILPKSLEDRANYPSQPGKHMRGL